MKKITNVLVAALILVLAGCASAPPVAVQPFDKSVTVEKSFDEVWSNLVRFMSTNDVTIGTIEKDSGLIALRGENLSAQLISSYCVVQPPFLWGVRSGNASGSITVIDDDGFVTVNANVRFQVTYVNSMSNPPSYSTQNCVSRGAFETALLDSVR